MRSLEIREKRTKLFMANSRQGTETFAVVFMVVVIHVAKVRVCAIYNKSKLHKLYSFFGCTILYVLFCLLRVRGDEVLAAVDDADKLGVFPLVELVYLIVVLLTYTSFFIL